ncbi:MAG TPA: polysaccharide deacetylase family protein [Chloroflexota bacterium]|jgi:peptidoglycan/xylan/chitin deacetylase (PgdA/CDA1 family)|nr:polysaccharide deacetylase family protein [Chloroflexota bacterium]
MLVLLGLGLYIARSAPAFEPTAIPPTATPPPVRATPAAAVREAPLPTSTPRAAATATAQRGTPTATSRPTARATPAPTSVPTTAPTSVPPTALAASPTTPPKPVAQRASVALTFDAGADRGYAEDILDLLRSEHVAASFGITGQWAKANPELVRRMAADGHVVFNHTLDHQSFTGVSDQRGGLSAAARRAELDNADAIIAPLIGHSTRPFFRLPYGDDDARVSTDVASAGYTRKVGWTIDTLGWRGGSASDIVDRSLRLAAPGAIYVLHVGHASQDGPALPRIVSGLRARGYGFVTVDALL